MSAVSTPPSSVGCARRPTWHTTAALSLVLAMLAACRSYDAATSRARADQAVLERQVAGLEQLVARAEKGSLLPADQLAVGLDESLIRDLIAAGLPLEQDLGERLRVRVEQAEVSFRGHQSLVTLRGRVSALDAAHTFVDLALRGGLTDLAVDPRSRRLRARLVLDGFELEHAAAGGASGPLVEALLEELGHQRLEAFARLLPELEIPVAFEQGLDFRGLPAAGPLRVRPGSLPVAVSVAQVVPLSGRLWVLLQVSAGPWVAAEEPGP